MMYVLLFLAGFLTDVCQCCETGYYSSNVECQKCPNNCASCSSASSCTSCNAGYYGDTCSENCPIYCHNNECNQISGQCLSCIEGYYNDGNNSCSKCPENCATCNSKQFCFTCKSGYKGEYCQSFCSSCKPGTSCDKHTGYCLSECVDGFSGELCDIPCDSKCKSCNRYKQQECISCVSERYGPSCNKKCSETCDLNKCDAINGSCTRGCIDGYWGEKCKQTCSPQCNKQVCYQSNGKCMNGYIDVLNGNESGTDNNFILPLVIIGVILCVGVIGVIATLLCKKIIRKSNSSTSSKSSTLIQCFESCTSSISRSKMYSKSRTLTKRKMKAHEDIESQTQNIADEKEIQLMINESNKKNTANETKDRVANTLIKTNPLYEKTQKDKNEMISLITLKPENKDRENMRSMAGCIERKGPKELTIVKKNKTIGAMEPTIVVIKRTGAMEQIIVEEMNRTGNLKSTLDLKETSLTAKPNENADTQIKQRNDDKVSGRVSTKNRKKQDFESNTDKNDNSNLKDEMISNTYGRNSTVSGRPVVSSLIKEYGTNISQHIGTDKECKEQTCVDGEEGLPFNDTHFGNMNSNAINDNETNYRIQVSRLAEYVTKKEKALYHKEFMELSSKGMDFKNQTKDLASSDMNNLKINCTRIGLPVVLEDDPSANANFIDGGPFELKAYIAYMGPQVMSMSCKKAFWKTVFQEMCGTIVMLTTENLPEESCRCFSRGFSCSEKYGDITVKCNGEQYHGSFTVRKYTIKKQMVERDVQRLMFTKWPSYSYQLPNDVSSFVNFLKYANKFSNPIEGRTMVYCSSGKERTGIYIALDILTKQGIDRGFVDIFGCVKRLREQRLNIIYSYEQYEFLHKALVFSLKP